MKVIFKSIVLLSLMAVLLAIWVPHFIAGPKDSANIAPKGSTIGGVEVGDLKGDDLKEMLTNAVNDWYTHNLTVLGGEDSIEVSSSTFRFDIEGTVNTYEDNYRKPWYAFWANKATVHLPLNVLPNEIVKNEISTVSSWDTDLTYEKVHQNASYLKTEDVEAVVIDLSILETDRISLSVEAIPEGAMGVNELLFALNDTVIEPQMPFSMIEKLGDAINLANREAINFIASNIYNAAIQINGEILERHSQNKIPSYLKPGLEAKVDPLANEDLKFANTLSTPVLLKLSMEDGKLLTEVYAPAKETEVSVTVSHDEEIQPRTITRFSKDLAIGQSEQLQQGLEGLRVSVYRTVYEEQKLVSRDYYPPVNRVLVKSSRQPEPQITPDDMNNDPDYQIDLDGDGFPDGDLNNENLQNGDGGSQNSGSSSTNNSSQNSESGSANNGSQNSDSGSATNDPESEDGEEEENLPPGSYYDKGGNLITP
ncbi:VanW family protein [Solibacillus silvestris]|uniref:VanW family protein n=1 Tax=Solibacillus silvestris TaxID=76853 RepID=UPI003F7CDFCB